jgi:hypothetical protein
MCAATFSMVTFSITTIKKVTVKHIIMLSADMLSVFMLAAIIKNITPNVLRISVVIVSVVAPKHNVQQKMITMLKPSTTANVSCSQFLAYRFNCQSFLKQSFCHNITF